MFKKLVGAILLSCLLLSAASGQKFPHFDKIRPVRAYNQTRSVLLNNIESHLQTGHPYDDSCPVTSAHECSHGIASRLRQLLHLGQPYQGIYVLNDEAIYFWEPRITLADIAREIPHSMRGMSYNLYLIQQQRDWNNNPLYVLDEWQAYSNGSFVAMELQMWQRFECSFRQCLEFLGYSLVMCKLVEERDPNYDSRQLNGYVLWHARRNLLQMYPYVEKVGALSENHRRWLLTLRSNRDTIGVRKFCIRQFGPEECKAVFGFNLEE